MWLINGFDWELQIEHSIKNVSVQSIPGHPAVKEVINSLSELCHRDVKSIRSCFRQVESITVNRHMDVENSKFYGNFKNSDVSAKRRVLRANRDFNRGQPSQPFAATVRQFLFLSFKSIINMVEFAYFAIKSRLLTSSKIIRWYLSFNDTLNIFYS